MAFHSMQRFVLLMLVLVISAAFFSSPSKAQEAKKMQIEGKWLVALETPGGPLNFVLDIAKSDQETAAFIVNGPERIPVNLVTHGETEILLEMEHFDSRVELRRGPGETVFSGTWTKRRSAEQVAELTCEASPYKESSVSNPSDFLGRWAVKFADSDDEAIGAFQRFEGSDEVLGTFLTTTGDYRYLHGAVRDGQLVLSCFDGAHAFLFHAKVDDQGAMQGDFWSGNWYHDSWTAKRNAAATLPDGFEQTVVSNANGLSDLQFPDVEGRTWRLGDKELLGKATLVEVFGTWCPNCHDEAVLLTELREKYAARGLKVVGLAFELTGDFARDAAQVKRYAKRFNVDYPILVAGKSDKAEASKLFPVLDRIRSYPTTLFLDSRGEIRAVYTGFSGPATGDAHVKLREQFVAIVKKLLDE